MVPGLFDTLALSPQLQDFLIQIILSTITSVTDWPHIDWQAFLFWMFLDFKKMGSVFGKWKIIAYVWNWLHKKIHSPHDYVEAVGIFNVLP